MTLQATDVPLAQLRPHPDNPRNGDLDAIKESLRVHGQYAPLIVAGDGTVLVGNHRYAAMLELGWETASVIRRPEGPFDSKAIKIMLIDNHTSDQATNDEAQVLSLLRQLDAADDGLWGSGFDDTDLADLQALVEEQSTVPLDLSNVETLPNLAEKLAKYQAEGQRMFVLAYPQEQYDALAALMAKARNLTNLETNAEVVAYLLDRHYGD